MEKQLTFGFDTTPKTAKVEGFVYLGARVLSSLNIEDLKIHFKKTLEELLKIEKILEKENRTEYLYAYKNKISNLSNQLEKINEWIITEENNPLYVNGASAMTAKSLSILNQRRIAEYRKALK